MRSYLDLLELIINTGFDSDEMGENRNKVGTLVVPGAVFQHDLRDGFPLLTTKAVNWNAVRAELCGFIHGVTSAADFREFGTRIWDQNANKEPNWLANPNREGEDDLGRIYGAQWRDWQTSDGRKIDQLAEAVDAIALRPTDRRIIVTAWNPGELDDMALPPCHLLYQFIPAPDDVLHITIYMRSIDAFLGLPFNIASYAALLSVIAWITNKRPGKMTMFLANLHVYKNHMRQVQEQLTRTPRGLPHFQFRPTVAGARIGANPLNTLKPEMMEVVGYNPCPAIKAPMAV